MADRGAILAGRASVELTADGTKLQQNLAKAEQQIRQYAKMADQFTRQAQKAFARGDAEAGKAFTQMAMQATASRNQALASVGSASLYGGFRSGGGGEEGGGRSRIFSRRGPLGESAREGFRAVGMSGAGGEAGYALAMIGEMGLAGGAVAIGVLAIAEGFKIAKEEAEALRETNKQFAKDVREAAEWTHELYRAPTTSLGEKVESRSQKLKNENADLQSESDVIRADSLSAWSAAGIQHAAELVAHGGDDSKTVAGIKLNGLGARMRRNADEQRQLDEQAPIERQRHIDELLLSARKEGVDKELSLLAQRREWIIADAKKVGESVVDLEKDFAAQRQAIIINANREIKAKGNELSDHHAMKQADMTAKRNHETLDDAEIDLQIQELRRKYAPNRGDLYRRGPGESIDDYRKRLYADSDKNTDRDKRREARDKANESIDFEKNLDAYANKERGARIGDFARGIRDELKTTADHLAEYKDKLRQAIAAEELTPAQAKLAEQMEEAKFTKTEGTFSKEGLWGWGGTNETKDILKKIEQNTRPGTQAAPGQQADTVRAGNPDTGVLTMA
jgi:hypothetical protein